MSDPRDTAALTPDRLAYLRMLATGATRHPGGELFCRNRCREAWLEEHGFITLGPRPPATGSRARPVLRVPVRTVEVTAKGREALEERRTA